MVFSTDAVEAQDFAGHLEACYLFASIFEQYIGLERTGADRVDCLERVTGTVELALALDFASCADEFVEAVHLVRGETERQAELTKIALRTRNLEVLRRYRKRCFHVQIFGSPVGVNAIFSSLIHVNPFGVEFCDLCHEFHQKIDMADSRDTLFNPQLIKRFDVNGPRYTSYPTADRFVEAFNADAYKHWLGQRSIGGINKPLSLYFHIPFCNTICYYCACNKIITKDHGRSAKYLKYIAKEIDLQASNLNGGRDVLQLHLGGGTPTFLSHTEMRELMAAVRGSFNLVPNGEYSIEVDPRKVDFETVALLGELGFNRMSIGVQDFSPDVQQAVNRIQSFEETKLVLDSARQVGFKSISMDLIYGLPKQNVISFNRTLEQVLELSPDRISLYSYAHLPGLFKPQRRISASDMPAPEAKLQILQLAIRRLTEAGYVYIGMDHFAKPDDELTVAQRQGRLHRNFQGYSTYAECDLMAFGVSAIGKVGPTYTQNVKTLDEYYDALDRDDLPILRGIELTPDDLLRRSIIQALMCHFELSIESIQISYLIDFRKYFAEEFEDLREMEEAGLLQIDDQWISVLPAGRMLVRAIAMVFDRYLRADRERTRYSKVI